MMRAYLLSSDRDAKGREVGEKADKHSKPPV